jgi:transposase
MTGLNPRPPSPTDLREQEWRLSTHRVAEAQPGGRPEAYSTRGILPGLFSLWRRGCSWRLLPPDRPPWRPVSHDFRTWRQEGTWQVRPERRRGDGRGAAGQPRQPRAGIRASPPLKTTATGGATATIRPHTSRAAHAPASSTPAACSEPSSSRPPPCQTVRAPSRCWPASATSAPAGAASGPIRRRPGTAQRGGGRCAPGATSASTGSRAPRGPRGSSGGRTGGWSRAPWAGVAATAADRKMRPM